MKVKGFELKPRMAYDVLLISSFSGDGEKILISYAKIIYDSIKLNWNFVTRIWNRWKFSPSRLLKSLKPNEIINAVKEIRLIEGAKKEDLIFLDYQLGTVSEDELMDFIKKNKKKVKTIQKSI